MKPIVLDIDRVPATLKAMRKAAGLTQRDVALIAKKTQAWVSKAERPHINHTVRCYRLYAKALGYDLRISLVGVDGKE